MDSVAELETLLKMSTCNAATVMGLKNYGLQPGCQADLVVLDASSPSMAIANQVEKLYVFKGGRLLTQNSRTTTVFSRS
jgi:cytosine deaminase